MPRREIAPEARPLAGAARQVELAVKGADDVPRQRQPEPEALDRAPRRRPAVEGLEDAPLLVLGQAGAGAGDADDDAAVRRHHGALDGPAGGRELARVV